MLSSHLYVLVVVGFQTRGGGVTFFFFNKLISFFFGGGSLHHFRGLGGGCVNHNLLGSPTPFLWVGCLFGLGGHGPFSGFGRFWGCFPLPFLGVEAVGVLLGK